MERTYTPFVALQMAINNFCKKSGITRDQFKQNILPNFNVKSTKDLNKNQIFNLIKQLQFSSQPIF
jgi:hypothetical protein